MNCPYLFRPENRQILSIVNWCGSGSQRWRLEYRVILSRDSLAAPDPKNIGFGESQHKKVWCHRNVGGTNQISPRQINDVTLVIDIVLVTIVACRITFSL